MNKDQARDFVKQTFTQAFDKSRFLDFAKNLVNHLDESKAISSMTIPNAFKAHVRSCTRVGTYRSPKGELADVLVVNTTEPEKIERTRTALRDFVAHKLKREEDYKEAGIVAFVSPDERNWRFSYIRMEYQSKRNPDTGKIVAEERVTPARRFSYIVGEGEGCHTAQARFLNLLQDTDHDPTLSEIEEAFSVEVVTKEFFTQYVKLFERINESLEKLAKKDKAVGEEFGTKGITTVDFAKKLMGQIVFLYFLQKRGWLGVDKGKEWGTGPRGFLRLLADRKYSTYKNFFNDVLEPLFYDTLATDRGYEAWCEQFNCRIPFLNGGLFEPPANYNWKDIDITLPNGLFTNDDYIDVGVFGTGVLDVFDRYNFTVNEAEPLETEVAIDPEMLGKVFENLIEENRRKGLGAFYTPREIVHYMCQETLINYLDNTLNGMTDKPMVSERVQQQRLFGKKDPQQAALVTRERAVLVPREDIEMFINLGEQISHYESVETTYKIRMPKSIKDHARLIDEKLRDITVCDPAVGSAAFLVMMMILMVRARLALTPYFTDVNDRTPYHFKRHAILNSLYGVDIDAGAVEIAKLRLWLSLVVDEEDVNQIKPLPNLDYRVVVGNSLVRLPDGVLRDAKIESELERLRRNLADETDNKRKREYREEIKKRVQPLFDSAEHYAGYKVNFDFRLFFSEVFHPNNGFDIVIGNPPYLNVELVSRSEKEIFAKLYKTFYKRFDVFGLFFELGLTQLVNAGTVALIVPQQILNNLSYKKLRELILTNGWLSEVFYLGDKVFDTVNNDVCVLFLRKPRVERIRLVNALHYEVWDVSEVSTEYFNKFNGIISFSDDSKSGDLFEKILSERFASVRKDFEVFQGIVTGNNEVFILTDDQVRKAHIEKPLLHRVLLGRDFKKWNIDIADRNILYITGGTSLKEFPNAEAWLSLYRRELAKRRECRNGVIPWFSLQWPRDKRHLDSVPKILVQGTRNPRLKDRIVATIDETGVYGTQGMNFIVPKDSKASVYFLLGILNSKVVNHLFATKFLNVAIKAEYLKDLRLPTGKPESQHKLVDLVKTILSLKKKDPLVDVSRIEREIDQLVYQLYGLTEDEIKIVEGK